jgi:hypothetical protein
LAIFSTRFQDKAAKMDALKQQIALKMGKLQALKAQQQPQQVGTTEAAIAPSAPSSTPVAQVTTDHPYTQSSSSSLPAQPVCPIFFISLANVCFFLSHLNLVGFFGLCHSHSHSPPN